MKKNIFVLTLFLLSAIIINLSATVPVGENPVAKIVFTSSGKFSYIDVHCRINVSAEYFMDMIIDVKNYKNISKELVKSKVTSETSNSVTADFEIDMPGSNTTYSTKTTYDRKARVIKIRQVKGDLKGSWWQWKIIPIGEKSCRVIYSGRIKNYSFFINRLMNNDQNMDIGLNTAILVNTVLVNKNYAEKNYR